MNETLTVADMERERLNTYHYGRRLDQRGAGCQSCEGKTACEGCTELLPIGGRHVGARGIDTGLIVRTGQLARMTPEGRVIYAAHEQALGTDACRACAGARFASGIAGGKA